MDRPTSSADLPKPSLSELFAASWKVGVLGFGGPAGQIALMHRIFVDEKRWIDPARYLHALSYCTFLPGPEAQQLATYVGWILHGVRGGLIAGLLFILPGVLVMLGLSWLYAVHGTTPLVSALFFGIKAAVVALVAEALIKVGKRALRRPAHGVIALGAFLALSLFGAPFPAVILAAALFGLLLRERAIEPEPEAAAGPRGDAFKAAFVCLVVWLSPLAAAWLILGPDHVLTAVGRLFSLLAVVTFGGAYATLAYLQQEAVSVHGWLATAQMIDGLGLAETTPGPLVLVNQFVGFMAGWKGGAGLAVACALMASWQTFAPSFLWIFAGAPYAEALRRSAVARNALAGVTAAVLGVIGNLAFWFAAHVLFTRSQALQTPFGVRLTVPDLASFDGQAAMLAVAAGVALIAFRINVVLVVLACAAAGVALRGF